MASSGDVEAAVVVDAVEVVEQPAEACEDERASPATTTTEGSQPTMLLQAEQHDDDAAPDADHHDGAAVAVAPPEEAAAELSASDEEPPERQKPMAAAEEAVEPEAAGAAGDDHHQESTRERLKRHRREMAGRVWVPELWGQEKLLKDWVDCAVFDRPLVPAGLLTARRALIAECGSSTRRPDRTSPASSAGSSPLRVHNGCS